MNDKIVTKDAFKVGSKKDTSVIFQQLVFVLPTLGMLSGLLLGLFLPYMISTFEGLLVFMAVFGLLVLVIKSMKNWGLLGLLWFFVIALTVWYLVPNS